MTTITIPAVLERRPVILCACQTQAEAEYVALVAYGVPDPVAFAMAGRPRTPRVVLRSTEGSEYAGTCWRCGVRYIAIIGRGVEDGHVDVV